MSTTPSSLKTINCPIFAAWEVPVHLGGAYGNEIRRVDLGDPTQIRIVSAKYHGEMTVEELVSLYATVTLKVDGITVWTEVWTIVGGTRTNDIDLTTYLSSAGIHAFEIDLFYFGSTHILINGTLEVQYEELVPNPSHPPRCVIATSTTNTTETIMQIANFLNTLAQLIMMVMILYAVRSIAGALKFEGEEGRGKGK